MSKHLEQISFIIAIIGFGITLFISIVYAVRMAVDVYYRLFLVKPHGNTITIDLFALFLSFCWTLILFAMLRGLLQKSMQAYKFGITIAILFLIPFIMEFGVLRTVVVSSGLFLFISKRKFPGERK